MDPQQLEALAQRLAENPADSEALNAAYAHGQTDPRGYAVFLEKTGSLSRDAASGAHWYCEAATVWTASLEDSHRAARALMHAVDKDPMGSAAAARLSALYREKNDLKGVVALYDRRIKLMERALPTRPDLRPTLASLSAELGRLWQDELAQPDKAIEGFRKAAEYDPSDAYSIYQLREALRAQGKLSESLPWFTAEARISPDPERQKVLYLDQADVARQLGDAVAELGALRAARQVDDADPNLKQQLGSAILQRINAGAAVTAAERTEARDAFIGLAETYDGEYGVSYASCALECEAGDDRGVQLLMYYAEPLAKAVEVAPLVAAYVKANPAGLMVAAARTFLLEAFSRGGEESLLSALEPQADAPAPERASAHGELARVLAAQGRSAEAERHYVAVLALSPADEEAVDFLRARLRKEKDYSGLRALLSAAAAVEGANLDQRLAWLSELAEICEGPLADVDGAVEARRRLVLLDPSDQEAAEHLEQTLQKAERWDDLAELLERRAAVGGTTEERIAIELRLAALHRDQRKDARGHARSLARLARLEPDDEDRGLEAAAALAKASEPKEARELLAELLRDHAVTSDTRVVYSQKLGQLLEEAGDFAAAGGAFAEAASRAHDKKLWAHAAQCFARGESFEPAARAIAEQRALEPEDAERGALFAVEADYLEKLGDGDGALRALAEASRLLPDDDRLADELGSGYERAERYGEWVSALLARADNLEDVARRVAARRRAAELSRDKLHDEEGMRAAYAELLEDVEDREALAALGAAAEAEGDLERAVDLLTRLDAVEEAPARVGLWLRLAGLLEDQGNAAGALPRYRAVIEREPKHVEALSRGAVLEQSVGDAEKAVDLYERLLALTEGDTRRGHARQLARLEHEMLDRPERAFAAYRTVLEFDADDFETVERLRDLSEALERWNDFVVYQKRLVEAEADEATSLELCLRLAEVLVEKLDQKEQAFAELEPFAALGPGPARERYLSLGDDLGRGALTARRLLDWLEDMPAGTARLQALGTAYERLVAAGAFEPALTVGLELLRQKGAGEALARSVEKVASAQKSTEGLEAAFLVLGRDLSGPPRAGEMVRQAEVLASIGVPSDEAIQHGEQALTSVPPDDAEPLLARLARLSSTAAGRVDVYERQMSRCKSSDERLKANCRAAEVALENQLSSRASGFFTLAVQSAGPGEPLDALIAEVRRADQRRGGTSLRALLADVLASAGQSGRDGGRSRSAYLSHAADLAHAELDEKEQAYVWLGEALIAHVDEATLDQLERLAAADGKLARAAEVIGVALDQVHDGPLVRVLLRRRHALRGEKLNDPLGAREDLKKLYEISPGDQQVADKLQSVYESAQDYRGLVHLFEDQILRSKDQNHRADLSRKVALLWQDTLDVPREAADAWRRVLRMKPGDEDAKAGLERAKNAQRTVTPEQIAKAEEETRKKLEVQAAEEAEMARRRESELNERRLAEEARIKKRLQRGFADEEVTTRNLEVPAEVQATVAPVAPLPGVLPAARAEMATIEVDRAELLRQAAEFERAATAPDSEVTAVTAATQADLADAAPAEPLEDADDAMGLEVDAAELMTDTDALGVVSDDEATIETGAFIALARADSEKTDTEPAGPVTERESDELASAVAAAPSEVSVTDSMVSVEDVAPPSVPSVPPPLPPSAPRASVPPPLPPLRPSAPPAPPRSSVPPPLRAASGSEVEPPPSSRSPLAPAQEPAVLGAPRSPSLPPGPPPRRPSQAPPGAAPPVPPASKLPPLPPAGSASSGRPLPPPLVARTGGAVVPPPPPPAGGARAPLPPLAPPSRRPPPPPPKKG